MKGKAAESSAGKAKSKPEKAKSGGGEGGAKKGAEASTEDDITVFDLRK